MQQPNGYAGVVAPMGARAMCVWQREGGHWKGSILYSNTLGGGGGAAGAFNAKMITFQHTSVQDDYSLCHL